MRASYPLKLMRDLVRGGSSDLRHLGWLITRDGRWEFSQACRSLRKAIEGFYGEGGLSFGLPDPENSEKWMIRTVIQPDGDVLMSITPNCVYLPDLWKRHLSEVTRKMKSHHCSLERINRTFSAFSHLILLLGAIVVCGMCWSAWGGPRLFSGWPLVLMAWGAGWWLIPRLMFKWLFRKLSKGLWHGFPEGRR